MQITVNKNIDEYKDDFYKGLTMKQTVIAAAAIFLGTGTFLTLYLVVGLPQSVSLYLAFPVVFPVGAAGFLRIRGLPPLLYLKRRRQVKEQPQYVFAPEAVLLEEEKEHRRNQVERPVYLETEKEAELWH